MGCGSNVSRCLMVIPIAKATTYFLLVSQVMSAKINWFMMKNSITVSTISLTNDLNIQRFCAPVEPLWSQRLAWVFSEFYCPFWVWNAVRWALRIIKPKPVQRYWAVFYWESPLPVRELQYHTTELKLYNYISILFYPKINLYTFDSNMDQRYTLAGSRSSLVSFFISKTWSNM